MGSEEEGYRDEGSGGKKGLERLGKVPARRVQCRKAPPESRVSTFSGLFKSDFQLALHLEPSGELFKNTDAEPCCVDMLT